MHDYARASLFAALLLIGGVAIAAPPVVTLSWIPSTVRADGSPLTGTSFFAVYVGVGSGNETLFKTGIAAPPIVITGASGQTWCFQVTQIDAAGDESARSTEVCHVFPASPPASPTAVTVK